MKKFKVIDLAAILFIAAFAFLVSFYDVRRISSPEELIVAFDGGYRVFLGQTLFKDFLFAHSLIVFWLLALFFKLFGVGFFACFVYTASISVVATICSVLIIRILLPHQKYLSYISGVLTAVWFNSPLTPLWPDQPAFLFVYIALVLLLFALCKKGLNRPISLGILFVSGVISFLPFLGKQNAGVFSIPLYFLLIVASSIYDARLMLKRGLVFLAGLLTSTACFLLWLFERSNLDNFIQYYITIPSKLGGSRIGLALSTLVVGRLGYLALLAIPIAVIWLCLLNAEKLKGEWRNLFVSAVLCLGLFFFQFFFYYTNGCLFGLYSQGIIFATEMGLLSGLLNINASFHVGLKLPKRETLKKALFALTPLLSAVYLLKGIGLYKQERTEPNALQSDNAAVLVEYLKQRDKNFFVFDLCPAAYGLLGKPSPLPLLWFDKGVTYGEKYNPGLDNWIVDNLKKNAVEIAVFEDLPPPEGTEHSFDDFPKFKSYIFENFSKTKEIGTFKIYELNGNGTKG